MEHIKIYGIILTIAGLFIRYQIGRRRFNRKSITGMQIFSSYLQGLVITILEMLFNLIGAVFILIGTLFIIIH